MTFVARTPRRNNPWNENEFTVKACEKCGVRAVKGERFCPTHKRLLLRRMESDGYLEPTPPANDPPEPRPDDLESDVDNGVTVEDLIRISEEGR